MSAADCSGPQTVSAARRRRRQKAAARRQMALRGSSTNAHQHAAGFGGRRTMTPASVPTASPDRNVYGPPMPDMIGKIAFAGYGAQICLPRTQPQCLMDVQVRPTLSYHGKQTIFGELTTLRRYTEGFGRYHNPDCSEKVAIPADELHGIPEVTVRDLARFRRWGRPLRGPSPTPLSRKVLKRHGKELQCHFDKKFVGDLGEVVDITEDFKRDRFREIQRCCEVDRSMREKHNGNPPVNIYLEHHNSGGEFSGNPYTCAAYAAQAETRELNQIGLGQIPRWPVGREAMHRVVPRLLKGKRPPPPKLETYSFVRSTPGAPGASVALAYGTPWPGCSLCQ